MPLKRKKLGVHDGKWRRGHGYTHANRPVRMFAKGWRESFSRIALKLLHFEKRYKFQPIPVQERPWVPKNKKSTWEVPPIRHAYMATVLKRSNNRKLVSWMYWDDATQSNILQQKWLVRCIRPWGDFWDSESEA